ncbi:di-trans,poly-cis-decaprenylcistransferase [archaeon]|nr:MAG: di-trans,poly-cis-decaprenylcistransferase [archaeon]RLG66000.1 MAG: di-trans,poly-cis-decaprenylcistransferase [archaeon]HDM23978.1 di-trans,poly-cis-decaprenylcistransferase [Candidatus Bathyarchaeota archaeon]
MVKLKKVLLSPIYKLYEKLLYRQIKNGEIPRHVAVILDGNRRWARSQGLNAWEGHRAGAEKVKEFLEWCWELNIKIVTLYVLSIENIQRRPEKELDELFKLLDEKLDELLKEDFLKKHKVRIKFIGRKELLPKTIIEIMRKIEEKTRNYDRHYLNIALAYSGRAEITDAVKKIAMMVKEGKLSPDNIDEEVVSRMLYTSDLPQQEPDFLIRTSGECRISGFLLWQIAYSELHFIDPYWPEMRKIDFWRAIRDYQRRHRRFGG